MIPTVTVTGVEPNSLAHKAGICRGDVLIAIDGHPISDILDYRFFLTESKITLSLQREDKPFAAEIRKGRYDDIGLEFETFLMDRKRHCANRCIFCFIDQNPCGMRETVYFKDDDTRLSFFMGNYVTLTNVSEKELERIISMRLSPVNVSVHTTNPDLRVKMLGNPKAGRIMDQLLKLKEGGIRLNCQIVACRGINDGPELERTVRELESLCPELESIAVVPAGLTRHREGLPALSPYDRDSAREVLRIVDGLSEEFFNRHGSRLVYAADEFYLAADSPIPPEEAYEGYPQLDNGVGLLRSNREEILDELRWRVEEGGWRELPKKPISLTLVTGFAAERFLREIAEALEEALPQIRCRVIPIPNRFFGETVTVAGLICGRDIIETLKNETIETLFIPAVSLRHERDLFLDDLSPEDVAKALDCKVVCVENGIAILDEIETLFHGR